MTKASVAKAGGYMLPHSFFYTTQCPHTACCRLGNPSRTSSLAGLSEASRERTQAHKPRGSLSCSAFKSQTFATRQAQSSQSHQLKPKEKVCLSVCLCYQGNEDDPVFLPAPKQVVLRKAINKAPQNLLFIWCKGDRKKTTWFHKVHLWVFAYI